jgi:predicted NodU family carbamoyl transferase
MWGKKRKKDTYEKCTCCGTTEIRHKGNGLCLKCYDRQRLNNPKRVEQVKKIKDKWYKVNKNRLSYILRMRYFQYLQKTKQRKKGITIVIDGEQVKTPIQTEKNQYYASEIKAYTYCYRYLKNKKVSI